MLCIFKLDLFPKQTLKNLDFENLYFSNDFFESDVEESIKDKIHFKQQEKGMEIINNTKSEKSIYKNYQDQIIIEDLDYIVNQDLPGIRDLNEPGIFKILFLELNLLQMLYDDSYFHRLLNNLNLIKDNLLYDIANKKKETIGESFIACKPSESEKVKKEISKFEDMIEINLEEVPNNISNIDPTQKLNQIHLNSKSSLQNRNIYGCENLNIKNEVNKNLFKNYEKQSLQKITKSFIDDQSRENININQNNKILEKEFNSKEDQNPDKLALTTPPINNNEPNDLSKMLQLNFSSIDSIEEIVNLFINNVVNDNSYQTIRNEKFDCEKNTLILLQNIFNNKINIENFRFLEEGRDYNNNFNNLSNDENNLPKNDVENSFNNFLRNLSTDPNFFNLHPKFEFENSNLHDKSSENNIFYDSNKTHFLIDDFSCLNKIDIINNHTAPYDKFKKEINEKKISKITNLEESEILKNLNDKINSNTNNNRFYSIHDHIKYFEFLNFNMPVRKSISKDKHNLSEKNLAKDNSSNSSNLNMGFSGFINDFLDIDNMDKKDIKPEGNDNKVKSIHPDNQERNILNPRLNISEEECLMLERRLEKYQNLKVLNFTQDKTDVSNKNIKIINENNMIENENENYEKGSENHLISEYIQNASHHNQEEYDKNQRNHEKESIYLRGYDNENKDRKLFLENDYDVCQERDGNSNLLNERNPVSIAINIEENYDEAGKVNKKIGRNIIKINLASLDDEFLEGLNRSKIKEDSFNDSNQNYDINNEDNN